MDARIFKARLKSPLGRFILMLMLIGVILTCIYLFTNQWKSVEEEATNITQTVRSTSAVTINKVVEPFRPPKQPIPEENKGKNRIKESKPAVKVLPINLYSSQQQTISPDFAPYGRLIPCELVNTVDSSRIQTPIIALVIEDIWHAGRLIIPAGTEVHGLAQLNRQRERIGTRTEWNLVWTDGTGRELPVRGLGLDMSRKPNRRSWLITDGSAGLRGYVIKTDNLAEIKLFTSIFLSGVASGLQEVDTIQTSSGSFIRSGEASLKDAALTGASAVLTQYAQQVLQRVREDGFYVRVPAGSTFYLYVRQPIDLVDAQIGGSIRQQHTQRKSINNQ